MKRKKHKKSAKTKRPAGGKPSSRARPASIAVEQAGSGPWGELEFYETWLEAPDALLGRMMLPSEQTVWHFVRMAEEEVASLLENAGLRSEQLGVLRDRDRWSLLGDHIRIFPPREVTESMEATPRATIYRILAQWPENPFHHKPIVLKPRDLETSDLSPELAEAIVGMSYRDCGVTLFSDLPLLLRHLRSPAEERQLLRTLTRQATWVVRLKLSNEADLGTLCDYWLLDHRQNDVLPLVESIAQTPGVDSLDIAHILPPGAKSRLFTYPGISHAMDGRAPDAFTAALSFFNVTPIPIYADSPGLQAHLNSFYEPVSLPFRFADVVMIAPKSTGHARHACVYIADDIVYTKNSADFFSPWMFMKLRDVVNYHVREMEAIVSGWRRQDLKT